MIPGTVGCWQVKDEAAAGPFFAACGCGWYLTGRVSKRQAKAQWHLHLRMVRDSTKAAA